MPKVKYECEICGTSYSMWSEALQCEARGRQPHKYNAGERFGSLIIHETIIPSQGHEPEYNVYVHVSDLYGGRREIHRFTERDMEAREMIVSAIMNAIGGSDAEN